MVLRTATRPRWLGLLLVAIALAVLAFYLGRWQYQVAYDTERVKVVEAAAERDVRPLDDVLAPRAAFPDDGSGQRVSATGHYVAEGQRLITVRLLDGREGGWVLDQFVVDHTGANLPIVRGWIAKGADAPPPPTGTVTLIGSLAPGEAPDERGVPEGQMTSIDLASLVNQWPGDIYNAFAFAVDEEVGGAPVAASGLERVPPPLPDVELNWRNVMYAVQWWCFGGFAIWMWLKMVRQAARQEREDGLARQDQGDPSELPVAAARKES